MPVAAASAIAALLVTSCTLFGSTPAGPVIVIGVDLPMSGAEGRAAAPALNGARFYVQQHPKLDGFTVSLVAKDDSVSGVPEPLHGATNLAAFVANPQVMAVIGPFDSSVARAEIPVANQASLAMVSPATSSPCLTRAQYLPAVLNPTHRAITCTEVGLPAAADLRPTGVNNYFRLATTDDLQGPAAADYAFRTLHLVRVATISDHEAYGQALVAGFTTRFGSLGGSIVERLDLDPESSVSTNAFLTRIKADGAQAVYFGGVTANRGCAIRQDMAGVFGTGEAAPYLGGDGIAEDPACAGAAGANAAGIYATVPIVDTTTVETAAPVIAAFRSAYPNPQDYGPYTVITYDAVAVLYDALHRAIRAAGGALPPRGNVISQLSVTHDFAGASGVFGFDAAGDTTRKLVSIFEALGPDPRTPWKHVGTIDYTNAPPY